MARGTKGISPVPRPGWRCQPSHTQHGHTTVLLLNRFPQNGILTRGPLPLKRTSQHALAIAVSGQDIFFPPSCTAQVGPSDPTYTVDRIAPRLGDYSVECIQSASHNFQPHEYCIPLNIALRLSLCQGQVRGQPGSPRLKVGGRCHGRKVPRRALQVLAPPDWVRQRRAEGRGVRHRTLGCSCPC